jgi:hypothetical protein
MDRWGWMALKAYAPAFIGLLFSVGLELISGNLTTSPYLKGLAPVVELPSIAGFVASVGYAVWVTYQLKRWERGEALVCSCGGLLGWQRAGIRGWGAFRKCFACGRNVNHRHYE